MKNKIIIVIFIFLITANLSLASDYYPEIGVDPFFSSLNPEYIDGEQFTEDENNVFQWFKKKFGDKSSQSVSEKKIQSESQKTIEINIPDVNSNSLKTNTNTEKNIKQVSEVKNKTEKKASKTDKPMTKKELEKALIQEEREKEKELAKKQEKPQISLKDRIFPSNSLNTKKSKKVQEPKQDAAVELKADKMEYFPDSYEVEAVGNAQLSLKRQGITLNANKITYDYDRNVVKAYENVVMTSRDSVTEGDFARLDLTNPDGWVEKPVTLTEGIEIKAAEANIHSDKIEEYDGVAKIIEDTIISVGSTNFAGYIDHGNTFLNSPDPNKQISKGVYSLKAKTIYIDSKEEHEVITVKNANLYLKNRKIGVIPTMKIVTNKAKAYAETNMPEFGTDPKLGLHFGPAIVLSVPGGSTLKLAPIITHASDKTGIGGIARFKNEYNSTEVAYGTSKEELLIRGRHKLAQGLMLEYSRYMNQNEWFLGFRKPKYAAQLSYSRSDYVKDLKLRFSQRYSAGAFVDDKDGFKFRDAEWRFRWMTQTSKPLYSYKNKEGNISFRTGLTAQTSAAVYTTGNTLGIVRFGPFLSTNVGPWKQSAAYYQTAGAGSSPFRFDRYRYGRSNVVLLESLRICKYLSVGYLASIAMNRDVKSDDLFQENRFLISIGPEYARVILGYDNRRRTTMVALSMAVGTKDSDIEFKKAVVDNPDRIGKDKSKQKNKKKKKNYKKYVKEKV